MLRRALPSVLLIILSFACAADGAALLKGQVFDAETGKALAHRIYIQGEDSKWHFPKSASPDGSAIAYRKQRGNRGSIEMHTTLSAHPFNVELPPGQYTITVERGKEYFPVTKKVTIGNEPASLEVKLNRWIDMARLGWYSGDTHVHRTLAELPNVQLAEHLNVSFPLLYWVTKGFQPPGTGDKTTGEKIQPRLISIDDTHVIYPLNTEYEIFTVDGRQHTLGAFFVLNHKSVFQEGTPPVSSIAAKSKLQGGLLELDKHNWPWSMMLVPVMGVDLFELSNNHVWRTEFGFTRFGEPPPEFMNVETDAQGFTERGWIEYGFQNYYTLLNCGFRLRPTAGTASGVHPVPLGFGRVYVKLEGGFDYDSWIQGLDAGRSFVTTGPMLFVKVDNVGPGHVFHQTGGIKTYSISGTAQSIHPLGAVEILANGRLAKTVEVRNKKLSSGAYSCKIDESIDVAASSWIAVRCFEQRPDGRCRFAHTGPFHVEVEGRPLVPRKAEIDFLVERMQTQIKRNEGILGEESLDEYRKALTVYEKIARSAK
ncbi:MAG: hypothetical protein AMJ65_11915 [Phycisphaerae bacterium SG8_4]|nr:MAG: hypothetical protein AMJ65_11915 [Phycisphaerae bacterium SG8_4]